jgi:hypothetical protein
MGRFLLLTLFLGIWFIPLTKAQDVLLDRRNMAFSLHYGFTHYERLQVKKDWTEGRVSGINPITFSFDYGAHELNAVGLVVGFYTHRLDEEITINKETKLVQAKGTGFLMQARLVRHVVHKPRFAAYVFMHIGASFDSFKITDTASLYQNFSILRGVKIVTRKSPTPRFDFGYGMKGLITRNIGLSVEAGLTLGIAQAGIFYRLLEKSRRPIDHIGW